MALALPQRSPRRFFPRRGEDTEVAAAEVPAEEAIQEESEKPRIRITRPSSLTPRPQISKPIQSPVLSAAAPPAAAPVRVVSPALSRSRGRITFLESIRKEKPEISASKLAQLTEATSALQVRKPSSRPFSRSSSRLNTRPISQSSTTPVISPPSPPISSSRPIKSGRPSIRKQPDIKNVKVPFIDSAPVLPVVARRKSSGSDQSSRRQRLLQIKKRPRTEKVAAVEIIQNDMTHKIDDDSNNEMEKMTNIEITPKTIPKLDDQETVSLDAEINEAVSVDKMMQMMDKKVKPVPLVEPVELQPVASIATKIPETTTTTTTTIATTPAPAGNRKVSALTRFRSSRPAQGSRQRSSRPNRVRASTPVLSVDEAVVAPGEASVDTTVRPRLSSRRGGRGNSRGGASIATRPTARTSSRGTLRSRIGNSEHPEVAIETEVQVRRLSAGRRG